jgi:hypothetical protein
MFYIFDTNIWIDLSRGTLSCEELVGRAGLPIALAPFIINEFMKGLVTGGEGPFERNREAVKCMASTRPEILELPKSFIFRILWNVREGVATVRPQHYRTLIDLLVPSRSLEEFLRKTDKSESEWKRLRDLRSIHDEVLNKELGSLTPLAERASLKSLTRHMVRGYELGGLLPDPDFFETTFSAAVEFLKTSIVQVRNGAKPRKNNPGMYVDSQLFWYLADPRAVVVTREDFSTEIRVSPQKARIISYEQFRTL